MPYIVRIERGVINRGKYDIAYLADPAQPDRGLAAVERARLWNRQAVLDVRLRAANTGARRPTPATWSTTWRCAAASWWPRRR